MKAHVVSRRVFLRAAVTGAAGALVAACAPTPAAPAAPTQPAATEAPAATPVAAPVKIIHAVWGGVMELDAMNKSAEAFHEEYPDITVEILQIPQDYNAKVEAMMAAGQGLDTLQVPAPQYAPRGAILNLQPYIEADANIQLDDLFPSALDIWRYKGDLYGLPYGTGPQVFYWRKDFAQEAGLADPNELASRGEWNWSSFLEYAKALTKVEGSTVKVYGYFTYARNQEIYEWIFQNGGQPYNKEFNEAYFDRPEVTEAIQFPADLIHKEKIAPESAVLAEIGTWNSFLNGATASFISGPWQRGRLVDIHGQYDIAPLPENKANVSLNFRVGQAVWVGTKYPDACYKWTAWRTWDKAAEIWSSLGVDLPPRKSQFTKPFWYSEKTQLEHQDVFLETLEKYAVADPTTFVPSKVLDTISAALDQVFVEGKPAAEVFAAENANISQLLKELQKWSP
jgi:multiple sugar transport system substrate-binding protein